MTPDDLRILHKRLAATEQALRALGRTYHESIATLTGALQQIDLAQQDLARRLTAVEKQWPNAGAFEAQPEHVNGG